jgi:photosystem II stability/assembly factor-like uncharacterized protein
VEDIDRNSKKPDCVFIAGYRWAQSKASMILYKSLNGGSSWTAHKPTSQDSYGYAVACVPGNSNIVYLGGRQESKAALYRTKDGGSNWKSIGASAFSNDYRVQDIAIHPKSTNIIYVGTARGFYRSKNSGETWEKIFNSSVNNIQINAKNPKQIFIAGYWGVQVSTDDGTTWEDLEDGLIVDDINCLAINTKSKWLYAGSNGGGIYKRKY